MSYKKQLLRNTSKIIFQNKRQALVSPEKVKKNGADKKLANY